ncbi:uncharacterized protein LOC144448505 [Glandiceps talaboti]
MQVMKLFHVCFKYGYASVSPSEAAQETVAALSIAVVAGSAAGVLVVIVITVLLVCWVYFIRRRMQPCRKHTHDENSEEITQNEAMACETINDKGGAKMSHIRMHVNENTPIPTENRENDGFTDKHTRNQGSVVVRNIAYESVDDICADKMDDTNRDDTVRGMKENIAYESFDARDNDEDSYATLE